MTLNFKGKLTSYNILRINEEAQVNYVDNRIEMNLDNLDDFFCFSFIVNR